MDVLDGTRRKGGAGGMSGGGGVGVGRRGSTSGTNKAKTLTSVM